MKLCELMTIGDNNAIGGLFSDAKVVLKKLQKGSNTNLKKLASELLKTIDILDSTPNIIMNDQTSVVQCLYDIIQTPTEQSLTRINDMLNSYSDDSGE